MDPMAIFNQFVADQHRAQLASAAAAVAAGRPPQYAPDPGPPVVVTRHVVAR